MFSGSPLSGQNKGPISPRVICIVHFPAFIFPFVPLIIISPSSIRIHFWKNVTSCPYKLIIPSTMSLICK